MSDLLSSLNPMQRQAVLHGDGPLLILAGAGSGKTRTLTHRVAHLIGERGVPPSRILAVTFTNKAAAELRERVARLLGETEQPWVSTFHSSAVRILRREIHHLGFQSNFAIYDDQDQERLIKECLRELEVTDQATTPRAISSAIDAAKNRGLLPHQVERGDLWNERLALIYGRYQDKLRRANALDFGDLLLWTVRLFEEHPDVLERYRGRLLHVLVDEYQDTNQVQYRLTNLLASRHKNLCVVGDDDQSIYRWRGADVNNILDFEKDYPDTVVIRLEQNYRSTGTILDAAGAVVERNERRKGKKLWTENPRGDRISVVRLEDDLEEARYVATEIQRLQRNGTALRDIALFYRANAQSRSFEEMMVRHRLPYAIFGGIKFFARAEVKDVLAYLRVLTNPADSLSAKRIVNLPARGLGAVTVDKIAALDEEAKGFLPACRLALERQLLTPATAERLRSFVTLMDTLKHDFDDHLPPGELGARVIEMSGYGPMLRDDPSPEAADRLQNLDELLKGLKEAGESGRSLEEYLEQIALVTDLDSYDSGSDRLTMMTFHSAKGLEFPYVFMTAMEEGLFPHSRSSDDDHELEEERRLCYVGITRAMKKLYLTHARRRRTFGEATFNDRSRFVDEIPVELVQDLDLAQEATPRWEATSSRPWANPNGFRGSRPSKPVSVPAQKSSEVRVVYDEPEDGLRIGARVRHATFGVGVVKGVEGSGDGRKATVLFQNAGLKKLMLRFAGLEPV